MMKLIYILCFLLVLCSCEEKGPDEKENLQAVTFSISPDTLTRAMGTAFEPGDEIGIFAVERTTPGTPGILNTASYAINRHYRVDNNGKLQPVSKGHEICLSRQEYYDFYAYYPYQEDTYNPLEIDFKTHYVQNTAQTYKQSDIMFAQNLGVLGNTYSIGLSFMRKMAAIEFQIAKESGIIINSANLYKAKYKCQGNLATGTVEAKGSDSMIEMYPFGERSNAYTFRALLPEQLLPTSTQLNITCNGNEPYLGFQTTSDVPLSPGKTSIFPANMMYRVHLREIGQGTVNGAGVYGHGQTANVTAIPAPNYELDGWYVTPYGDWSDDLPKVSTNLNYSFPVLKTTRLIAKFVQAVRRITVTATTVGGGTGGYTVASGTGYTGDNYAVSAHNYAGYYFQGWYINNVLVSTGSTYSFIIPGNDVTIEGRFTKTYMVSINATPGGSVRGNSSGIYPHGAGCMIEADPNAFYTFDGWYIKNNTELLRTDPLYNFNVYADGDYTARFSTLNTINVILQPDIVVTGYEKKFKTGETCTLTGGRGANRYYGFGGYFEENGDLITYDSIYSFTVTGDRTLRANRKALTYFAYNRSFPVRQTTSGSMNETHVFPYQNVALTAGESLKLETSFEWIEQPQGGDFHSSQAEIAQKGVKVTCNDRVITITDQKLYRFTVPETGTYNFEYTMGVKNTLYPGEKCSGIMRVTSVLWKQ